MASDFEFITSGFKNTMLDIRKTTDRSTMYALRETGRRMSKIAKAKAPKYKGTDKRALAESGALRMSIKNSRVLTKVGTGDYSMKVGPFAKKSQGTDVMRYGGSGVSIGAARAAHTKGIDLGKRQYKGDGRVRGVPLYRGQMEEKYGYMAAAYAEADATVAEVYENALAAGYRKYRT